MVSKAYFSFDTGRFVSSIENVNRITLKDLMLLMFIVGFFIKAPALRK